MLMKEVCNYIRITPGFSCTTIVEGSDLGGGFLISGIWVFATYQGRSFTSKNPEQAPNFELFF